jgi:MFS family permease
MNSFVQPARQSMIPEIVGPARLMNAFALYAFGMNVLRLGAPALAGGVIATFGAAWVFTLMAVLFLLALVSLFRVPKTTATTRAQVLGARPARPQSRTGIREIREALVYLRGQRILCMLLVLQSLITILSLPYQRLLPGFVDEVLSGGDSDRTAALMGALLSFTAIGALGGSLLIASLPSRSRGKLMIGSLAIFAVGLLAFAASETFWLSAAIVIVLGVGQAGRQSLVQILIQSHVSDQFRGRISSILLLEDGIESLGIFLIALLARALGPQVALGIVAIALGLFAAGMWVSRSIRELD